MLDGLNITEADAAGLSELAGLDLAMARDFARRAQAAEDPDVANDLARSYQRMARSYRQSLALKVRLQRETIRADKEAPPAPRPAPIARDEARIQARIEELRGPVQRVIWAEHEPAEAPEEEADDTAGYYFDLLEERLVRLSRIDSFGLEPLDDHVAAICEELSLDGELARTWRDLPDPPEAAFIDWDDDEDTHGPAWRGSG